MGRGWVVRRGRVVRVRRVLVHVGVLVLVVVHLGAHARARRARRTRGRQEPVVQLATQQVRAGACNVTYTLFSSSHAQKRNNSINQSNL